MAKKIKKKDTSATPARKENFDVPSFLSEKNLLPLLKDNRVLLAALGGAAAGAALTLLLSAPKTQEAFTRLAQSASELLKESSKKATGKKKADPA